MSILVVDVGTSGLRAAVVRPDATITAEHYRPCLPDSPMQGLVEFDATAMATLILEVANLALAEGGPVEAVGIANQRASTIVWDRATGQPIAPALGWQDLRTIGDCFEAQAHGLRLAPNLSATKVKHLLDLHDPDRAHAKAGELCFGTVDTWVAWVLSGGSLHITDATNAALTGLVNPATASWDDRALDALRIPRAMLPTVVDSTGACGTASALPGSPPITGIAGDQQASLVGQGCVVPGPAKITFGTGGMLDRVLGTTFAGDATRNRGGTFPIVCWREAGTLTFGIEAVMLSAGTNVEWLRDDLGIIATAEASHEIASQCDTTDGVVYVPALLGLGTPHWDYGARGSLFGITRGTGRPQIVRAVLEGIAERGADLVAAAETDGGAAIPILRVDGGMSRNSTFVQALANATQRPVEISPVTEATTLGAALLAGMAVGTWGGWDDVAATWRPSSTVEPGDPTDRDRWARAVDRAKAWHPELSGIDF